MSHIVKWLSRRQHKEMRVIRREFQLIGAMEGDGYSFPCHADGSPDTSDQNYACWKDNLDKCLSHPEQYIDQGMVVVKHHYTEPAVALCSCGEKVHLNGDAQCVCGQWYNAWGQELLDPQYWGDDY